MKQNITILYVDDEPINIMVFESTFDQYFKIETSISGMAALDKLNMNPDIKIVISDMKMPLMNGIEFITEAQKKFPDIKYYILTGYGLTEEIAGALKSNLICKYFSKPFNVKEILKSIETAIS